MSPPRMPQVGDLVVFHQDDLQPAVNGQISQVWSEACVNVEVADGTINCSVPLVQEGPKPGAYWCEFAPLVVPAPAPPAFRFSLGATPTITVSGEVGLVIARAEFLSGEPTYLLQYRRNDGVAGEQWWRESALS